MTLGLRGRIAVVAMAASAAALLAVLALVGPGLHRRAVEHEKATLLAEARLMARIVALPVAEGRPVPGLDALVDDAARELRARVTVIAPDGRVLADSSLSGEALGAVENHAGRPEVQEALASGSGTSVRRSTTVGDEMLYAAVPIRYQGRVVGVSRVALSLRGVAEQARALQRAIAVALALAFLLTAVLSAALSSPLAGPLNEVMDAARRFALGDLSARSRVRRGDELGELARIVNRSADQLQERITEIARDRARTEAILSAMDDGVMAVDHAGMVVLANRALRDGLQLREAEGRHYLEVVRQSEVGALLEEVLGTGERRTAEVEMLRGGRAYAVTGMRFPGPEGHPHGAVLTFHDVTERHRVERLRRDFVANASHELRTPLTSIRGFVEALEDGAVNEPQTAQRFLEKIRRHADRMAALVSDLLELSRMEAGERPPRWETVHPADLVEEVVASLGELARSREIAVSADAAGAPPVMADRDQLRQILENLLENAVKYTAPGGQATLAARAGGDGSVAFEVSDDGPGIPAEHLPRIFERFYRVDKARSRDLGGTGLGLSIVKHLAEGMGATVAVESEPGRGTRFRVHVPSRQPSPAVIASPKSRTSVTEKS
jgi:two-component system, OmpR family, phosphate regulon sensor histidine kinase PhoR